MKRSDDQVWFDLLAGREAPDVSPETRAEATLLRAAMREWQSAVDPIAAEDEERTALLMRRAAAAGILAPRKAAPGRRPATAWLGFLDGWLARSRPWLAAGALAGLALGVGLFVNREATSPVADEPAVRAAPDAVVVLKSRDPAGLKRDLILALAKAGVTASGYTRLGREGIDADLPQPLPPAVRTVLDRYGIPPPVDGVLRVEIAAKIANGAPTR